LFADEAAAGGAFGGVAWGGVDDVGNFGFVEVAWVGGAREGWWLAPGQASSMCLMFSIELSRFRSFCFEIRCSASLPRTGMGMV